MTSKFFLSCLLVFIFCGPALSQTLIPNIRTIGVIPMQWDGSESELSPIRRQRALIESSFSGFVDASGRFRTINPSLVAKNWQTPEGRRDLANEFELDAYISLQASEEKDLVVLTIRLLSPTLENYLVESERILMTWLERASDEQIAERVRRLSFRLLNRYPIDVYVTSLQGPFVTLSGGNNQNIFEGDELSFSKVRIQQTHPVNGSWLSFEYLNLGEARVIEAKENSAIAKLTSLQYQGAVNIGAGAKIARINSRRYFANISEKADQKNQKLWATQSRELSIDKDKYVNDQTQQKRVELPEVTPLEKSPEYVRVPEKPKLAEEKTLTEETIAVPADEVAPPPPETNAPASEEESDYVVDSFVSVIADSFDEISGNLGYDSLNVSGSAPMASTTPPWLMNRFGMKANSSLDNGQNLNFNLYLRAGNTKDGQYFGANFEPAFQLNILDSNAELPFLDSLNLGAFAGLQTLQVTGESFGGFDEFILGPMIQLKGRHHMIDAVKSIAFEADIKLALLGAGTAGLSGNSESITGVFGLNTEISAVIKEAIGELEWGLLVNFDSRSYTVQDSELSTNNIYFGVKARVRF